MKATLAGATGLVIGVVVGVLLVVALPERELERELVALPEPERELETEPLYTGRLEPLTLVDDFTGEEERVIRAIGREGNLRLDIACVANYVAVALAPVSGSFQGDNVEARWDGGESDFPFGIGSERRGNSVGMSELVSPLASLSIGALFDDLRSHSELRMRLGGEIMDTFHLVGAADALGTLPCNPE